ncbi:hypothetical protein [Pseudalkalibacillus hwajinpoensis]|uniref:hypothetical protein n=1 Tax=Guptibacillus hwajinpoensis TaxID=208199 RepID=UPI001CFE4A2D|nr:hypothetical protein [Pseudalkalibacillus hwajinpoensis]
MKKLNLYKIIGIFVSFALFLIIFNQFQNGEPNFKVNDSMFDVYESVSAWEKSMSNRIPQLQLAKEIGALKNNQHRIPLLAAGRDLVIHDVMVVHYGAVYVTYSFSMKEKDEPYNLPTLQIGSLRFKGNTDQSYLVNQQQISSESGGKPSVIEHRLYRADILYPNREEVEFIEEFDQFPDAKSVILENLVVQVNDEKVKLDNQELDLSSDYSKHIYAEADLNQRVHTEEGNFIFTRLEAGLNSNKLYIEGMNNPRTRVVMKNATEEDFYSFERTLLKDDRGTYVALEPFRSLQEKFSYKVNEVIFNKDGVIRKEITNTDWGEMKKNKKIRLGEYSGLTYSIHTEDKGVGHQLVISIDAKKGDPPQLLNQFYIESKQAYKDRLSSIPEEERAFFEEQKPVLLGVQDKNKNDVLIYQTTVGDVPKEFRVDFDYEHFSSGVPAVITLSNLPHFESVDVDLKGSLERREKNK